MAIVKLYIYKHQHVDLCILLKPYSQSLLQGSLYRGIPPGMGDTYRFVGMPTVIYVGTLVQFSMYHTYAWSIHWYGLAR